ncbi:hypothetical protein G7Z17_g651 [Cylindrodendrum hubeiense]|uniref:Ankyrin repeat protein n=1 Tax=Cylindrodendrum hubeiense TaxID=595255 RepID=A0A9P5LD59_9HYPO|nr:hypothetical protein G7Z17_g651 [Cylindrodendrum hubeiense]
MLPSSRLGGPGLTPEEAYFIILQQIKQRRRDEWDTRRAVDLVNDLVNLNDELHSWRTHVDDQLHFLSWLRKDSITLEKHYETDGSTDETRAEVEGPVARVDRAIKVIQKRRDEFENIFLESNRVLEALFRLRTIQQNELATSADRTNKTIVMFTIVSLIFMPLTFLTSYFAILPLLEGESTNETSVQSSTGHQVATFWSIGAPLTVGIACFAVAAAFRRNILFFLSILLGFESRAAVMHEADKMA